MRSIIFAAAASTAAMTVPAMAEPGFALERTALRSGPGDNYRVITYIPEDAEIDVGQCRNDWCRVQYAGRTGYAAYLDVMTDDELFDLW